MQEGDVVVRVDPRYFRPAVVETLLGDSRRAREELGWAPQIGARELVSEMARADLEAAQRLAHLRAGGGVVVSAARES